MEYSHTSSPIARHFVSFTLNSLPPDIHLNPSSSNPIPKEQMDFSIPIRSLHTGH